MNALTAFNFQRTDLSIHGKIRQIHRTAGSHRQPVHHAPNINRQAKQIWRNLRYENTFARWQHIYRLYDVHIISTELQLYRLRSLLSTILQKKTGSPCLIVLTSFKIPQLICMTFVTFLKCFPRTHLSSLFLSVLQNKVIYLNTLSMCPPLWCTTHSRRR